MLQIGITNEVFIVLKRVFDDTFTEEGQKTHSVCLRDSPLVVFVYGLVFARCCNMDVLCVWWLLLCCVVELKICSLG